VTLDAVRAAIDTCGELDPPVFARRTRNAIALALVGATEPEPTDRRPTAALDTEVDGELRRLLADVYAGGRGWTTSAIAALEPLHRLARSQWSPS
jgi:hypothetical protein